ncbi:hypothetical protein B0G73_107147 [Paraburkholderia sp. BL25I1N1]|nr:hypothetical protein B0G73_107147 [Paraburkholderia sp. BL25I1N1]
MLIRRFARAPYAPAVHDMLVHDAGKKSIKNCVLN